VRMLILASHHEDVVKITVTVAEDVATYLNNRKRRELARIEDEGEINIQIFGRENVAPEHLLLEFEDETGREVKLPGLSGLDGGKPSR
jgi:ribonuclease E